MYCASIQRINKVFDGDAYYNGFLVLERVQLQNNKYV